jgi:hypothetical protein
MAQITSGLTAGQSVVTGTVSAKNNTTTGSSSVSGINSLTGGGLSGGGFGR